MPLKKALLVGFFSTVGDTDALRVVQRWLDHAGIPHDTAPYAPHVLAALPQAVDLRKLNPAAYTHLIVICGPCWKSLFTRKTLKLEAFAHCFKIGINLTMVDALTQWNPFDVLLERDSDRTQMPDLTFLEPPAFVPVVGRCLVTKQREYGARQRHAQAAQVINAAIKRNGLAPVEVDTRWCAADNFTDQRSSAAVLSVLKKTDLLLTTRLHGLVFGLRAGIPVIAIDPIAGGDKVAAQARILGWPKIALAEEVSPAWLDEAVAWCLSPASQPAVQHSLRVAQQKLAPLESQFLQALKQSETPAVKTFKAPPPRLSRLLDWMK